MSERTAFIIGVAGGTASGKTTVCEEIVNRLNEQCVVMLSQDSFYRGLTPEEEANVKEYNFDHPSAFDEDLIIDTICKLRAGQGVEVPIYDFERHQRAEETTRVNPADVIILEGILVLHMERIRELCNMKVFVDTDDDLRLARRIQRDIADRGRDVRGVISQYTRFVKPAFDTFVSPSKRYADVIIPWGNNTNVVAIDLISQHIQSKLCQHELKRVHHNLQVIRSNFQIRGMHTIIRDRTTSRSDFVFYSDRLLRLVVEAGLGFLPFREKVVQTPVGDWYVGLEFARKLCGVALIRSGEAMETALRDCCKGIKIGKILVHRSAADDIDQPDMIYERLPADIADRHVLLMDPILGTGNTATQAIELLLSKGVPETNILFLTLISAPPGIRKVCTLYPNLKVITSEIDDDVAGGSVRPGVGEFGDRYYSS
ncbi:unnamed protein product [Pedinophyceae sp. YPF-701]|nr:unnamed protein product [Pedinophyceae sp. YPF-701]